ncbi:MAG: hypothetical protein AB7S68_11750 [Polyangiaceae bacterium]
MKRIERFRVWGLGALLCVAAACNSVIGADEPQLVDDLGSGGVGGSDGDASAGTGGNATGGDSGAAGKGGSAGSGGEAGSAATGGTAGNAGSAGAGGAAGSGGVAGAAGSAGTGGAPECNATDKDCLDLTPRECSDGQWAPSGPACDYACKDGACYGECVKDTTECAGKKFRSCGADFMWTETDCPLVCDSTNGCVGSCLPDTYQCNGATVLEKCSAQGQYQTDQVCAHECAVVGGTAKCVDCTNGDSLCPAGCSYANDTDCPKGNGVTCGGNGECGSGFCVDGVCCNTSCTGSCMECNLPGKLGTCSSISFTDDVDNCGSCGAACSGNHVTRACSGGQCVGACDSGYADCNGNKRSDGCETNTQTNADHCGSCNAACSTNHIARVCSAGECGGTCSNGYADCNSNKRSDGCEINTNADPTNCSQCGTTCDYGVCQSATCAFTKWGLSGTAPSTNQLSANTAYGFRVHVANASSLRAIGAVTPVLGGDPASNVRLAVYTDAGGGPGTLVAQSGSVPRVPGATEGLVNPTNIAAGNYWVFVIADADLRVGLETTTATWWYKSFTFGSFPSTLTGVSSFSLGQGHLYLVTAP